MIIDSPIISGSYAASGSLNQLGNVVISGSLTITGGITGSISGSAISASFASNATSASYALTSSFSLNVPVTASYANNANSASFATTASNALTASYLSGYVSPFPFTGSAIISGSFTVTGSANIPNITGSLSGSLNGTASYAVTASNAVTASYLTGYVSPFPFTGSAVISGSLGVSGSLQVTNLSGSGVRYLVADESGSVTAQSASAALKSTQAFTSTAGQTTFSVTNGYSTGYVDVFINGSKLSAAEFTDTSGTNIVLATGSFSGDVVEVVKYTPAAGVTNNVLRQLTTFTATAGQTVFSASYTPGLIDIFYNGSRLSTSDYTANNGTFFTLATASAANDLLDVLVYSYQVGAFNGIGGQGVVNQLAFFNTTSSITGSNSFTVSGNTLVGTASYALNADTLDGSHLSILATTGSNTFTSAQYISNTSAPIGFTDTASLYTDGGLRATKTSYFSSSLYVGGDLVIFGTQSVNYITSSQLNIADNIITVNTSSPAVRFGGIAVQDSGSLATGLTGSLLWDSQNNHWIYSNPSGSSYSGGMLISGPRNTGSMGDEQGTTFNALMKGMGGDHITSSGIFESSSFVGIGTSTPEKSLTVNFGTTILGGLLITGSQRQETIFKSSGEHSNVVIDSGHSNTYLPNLSFQRLSTTFGSVSLARASSSDILGPYTESEMLIGSTTTVPFSLQTSGSRRLVITSAGNIGIGTVSPDVTGFGYTTLTIKGGTTAGYAGVLELQTTQTTSNGQNIGIMAFLDGSSRNAQIGVQRNSSTTTADMMFYTNAGSGIVERMRITSGGYVLIPSGVSATSYFSINFTNIDARSRQWRIGNDQVQYGDFVIATATTQGGSTYATKFLIDNAGNVGIGTSSPTSNLQIQSTSYCEVRSFSTSTGDYANFITDTDNTTNYRGQLVSFGSTAAGTLLGNNRAAGTFLVKSGGILGVGTRDTQALVFGTNESERMRITSGGNVGIGTNNPTSKLAVAGVVALGNSIDGATNLSYGGRISAKGTSVPGSSSTIIHRGLGSVGYFILVSGIGPSGTGRFVDLVYGTGSTTTPVTLASNQGGGSAPTRTYSLSAEKLSLSLSGGDTWYITTTGLGAMEE